jgi:energy-coupling factor transporter ATP-binding protein EcfA2
MAAVKTIKIEESIFADNDASAKAVREMLTSHHTTMLNVMSAPGSGKTTLLTAVIGRLSGEMKIRVMDVDIESTLDAQRVADATGVEALQIHNGGLCHIDADMVARVVEGRFDAVTFTSSSTVDNFVAAVGADAVPPVVVCIGPVTADTARRLGLTVTVEADTHTIDGLVAALVGCLGR